MSAKLIPQVMAMVVLVLALSFRVTASQKKMMPWMRAEMQMAATLLNPTQSSGMATGSRKAYEQVSRSVISASHMTTAEGTTTHSSSVSRATLLYLSSWVGMYMMPDMMAHRLSFVKAAAGHVLRASII